MTAVCPNCGAFAPAIRVWTITMIGCECAIGMLFVPSNVPALIVHLDRDPGDEDG